jgi:subfamily B ATP-binding cassette protein MsbA
MSTLILPLSYYAGKRSGDIITRMSQDVQEVEWSITNFLIMFLREPIALLIFLTALIIINPWLPLIAAVLIPVAGFFINLISKRLQKNAGLGQERLGWLTSILDETIQGIRISNRSTPSRWRIEIQEIQRAIHACV